LELLNTIQKLADFDAATVRMIGNKMQDVSDREETLAEIAKEHKAAKNEFEEAVAELMTFIKQRRSERLDIAQGRGRTLFDLPPEPEKETKPEPKPEPPPTLLDEMVDTEPTEASEEPDEPVVVRHPPIRLEELPSETLDLPLSALNLPKKLFAALMNPERREGGYSIECMTKLGQLLEFEPGLLSHPSQEDMCLNLHQLKVITPKSIPAIRAAVHAVIWSDTDADTKA
jgi:hypothetical protein